MSKDSTKAMMEKFALLNNEDVADMGFRNVKVCSNPGVTQPCAWNVALDNYSEKLSSELTHTVKFQVISSEKMWKN